MLLRIAGRNKEDIEIREYDTQEGRNLLSVDKVVQADYHAVAPG